MRMRRAVVVPIVGGLAAILGFGSTAWGCFVAGTQPVVTIKDATARAGSRIMIEGWNWAADSVSVRWESPNGTVLTTGAGSQNSGSFSVEVTIPNDSPGVHDIYVVQGGVRPVTKLHRIQISAPHPVSEDQVSQPSNTANATSGASAPAARVTPSQIAPADENRPPASPGAIPVAIPTATAAQSAPAGTEKTASRPAATTASGARAQAQSAPALLPAATSPTLAEGDAAFAPSPRAAAGDLWSGYAGGTGSAPAPSLLSIPGANQSSGSEQALLICLFMAGGVALFAGFGVAEFLRRKATAVPAGSK